MFVDLHLHSTASDGILTPTELVAEAKAKGLKAIAIMDHDTVNGIDEALNASKIYNMEVVPGIELDVGDFPEEDIIEIGVLGIFINWKSWRLRRLLYKMNKSKWREKRKSIKALQSFGVKITQQEVIEEAKGGIIGRPHIARVALRNNPDKFKDYDDVFKKYLTYGKPAHFKRDFELTMKGAIDAVHKAGGLAILEHPGAYINVKDIKNLIKKFKEAGGDGIETIYCYRKNKPYIGVPVGKQKEINEKFDKIADEFNLMKSGGSDFHDPKVDTIGEVKVPVEFLRKMKEKLKIK